MKRDARWWIAACGVTDLAVLAAAWTLQSARAADPPVDYATQIEPIFRASCYSCHQGDKAMAGFHLDLKANVLSAKGILAGNSAGSPLLQRLLTDDSKTRMPLASSPLAPEKIALIKTWIDQGAIWPDQMRGGKHWAYVKPARPALPAVKNQAWVRNPIDSFVLARLEKEGLAPSPEASRETLIRRLSLDLIGLPPTPQEVDAFVADARPDAYEKLVDRLMASPHYGERWARPWLDLARYADTNGFEKDLRRAIWKYRDWVITALNRDLPFDQFTIDQLAGDMLPDATVDQKIASGFNRNTMFNEEGGVDKEEAHYENLIDRVNTTSTVWLGSTLGCSQCHNHKYDPFTQKDYYQFMAFFGNSNMDVKDYGDTSEKYIEPQLDLPTPEQDKQRAKLKAEIAELEKTVKTPTPELAREQAEWERSVEAAQKVWTTLVPAKLSTVGGTTLTRQSDDAVLASGTNPRAETYLVEGTTAVSGITAIRLEAIPHVKLPRGGPGRDAYGNFFLTAVEVEAAAASAPDKFEPVAFKEIAADNGRVKEERNAQLWTVDASPEDTRLPRQIVFVAAKPFGAGPTLLRVRLRHESEFNGQAIGHFRLSVTAAPDPAAIIAVSHKLRPVLAIAESARTAEQKKELSEFYISTTPTLKPARQQLTKLRKDLDQLGIASTLIMGDRPGFERPSTYLRVRGAFLTKGDLVYANVPAFLPPLTENEMPNRLGLARWLVSRENPLTARVAVNRFWEQIFGRGIVETSEDFGTQGARPSHPELLDWLAVEFMDSKWSMKTMQRLMVTSATYRQVSKASPELVERDPYNRLFARGPRFRVEAEMIRDVTLAASGLLSSKIGGPSVFPPQPEGIWDIPYSDDKWVTSGGEDRYRRGLYTFVRRTAGYPTMLTFDSPSRESCTVRRVRTNTPLQALTTLNDPAFFETAQALAKRVVAEGGADGRSRAELAFRLCMSRRPKPDEVDRLLSWQQNEMQYFVAHPAEAQKLAGAPELASWTMLSNVLLNLDETLTKE